MLNQTQAREKFIKYFDHLRESMRAEGGNVNRYREWETFKDHMIGEGELPESARDWKCPRK